MKFCDSEDMIGLTQDYEKTSGAIDRTPGESINEPAILDGSSQKEISTPGRSEKTSLIQVIFSHLLIAVIALFFFFVYANTFRGHPIYRQTHGPFNFECGIYRSYAEGRYDIFKTDDNKLIKHLLCAILYPVLNQAVFKHLGISDAPLVCSGLGSATIALFGIWLYWRTRGSPLVFLMMLLLGFSFNTWYVSSVWESRAFIMLGAMVLLWAIDLLIRKPRILTLLFAILAMVFSILISIGNAYLLPLIPFALLFRVRRIGLRKLMGWSLLYLAAVTIIVAATYQIMGARVNPNLKLHKLIELSRHEEKTIKASPARLNWSNYRNVSLQSLVYSVGGLYLPSGDRMCDREWVNERAYQAYIYYIPGIAFVLISSVLIMVTVVIFFRKLLWLKEPVLWVIILWMFLYITFFVYFNPWAGSVYAAELQPVLWAFFAVTLSYSRSWRLALIPLFLALILAWNNYTVIRFFRYYYGDETEKAEISRSLLSKPDTPLFRPGGV